MSDKRSPRTQTLSARFKLLDGARSAQMAIKRACASFIIPEELPPESWDGKSPLPQPNNSTPARGAMLLGSKVNFAMMPVGDLRPFDFKARTGEAFKPEVMDLLTKTGNQLKQFIDNTNHRDVISSATVTLLIVGDKLILRDGPKGRVKFRAVTVDRYVVVRDADGEWNEVIWVDTVEDDKENRRTNEEVINHTGVNQPPTGYRYLFTQVTKPDKHKDKWVVTKQYEDGTIVTHTENEGIPTGDHEYVPPCMPWAYRVPNNSHYSPSYAQFMLGDMNSLTGATTAAAESLAQASMWWPAVDPSGITRSGDIFNTPVGTVVEARVGDVGFISPAASLTPTIQASKEAKAIESQVIETGFMAIGDQLPRGERVPSVAVTAVVGEIEKLMGGAFSSLSRTMWEWTVLVVLKELVNMDKVAEDVQDHIYSPNGELIVSIQAGVEAMARDVTLTKFERALGMMSSSEELKSRIKWDAVAQDIFAALGMEKNKYVLSAEEYQKQIEASRRQRMQDEITKQLAGAAGGAVQAAATNDINNNGGAGVGQVIQGISSAPTPPQ